jgi:hypothetical protein
MSEGQASMYAPDYLRNQKDKQLHDIADMIELQIDKIQKLKADREVLVTLAKMVEDNSRMPHSHTDPQLRLYCLAERANEALKSTGEIE